MKRKKRVERTKYFETIEAASRALRALSRRHRYEILTTYTVKTVKVPRRVTHSYLRKVQGKKRRVRVHVSYVVYERKRERVRLYYLSLVAATWVELKKYVESILTKYEITTHDPPRKFLKWHNTSNQWWGWIKKFPPYPHAFYVVVEVWFVVLNRNTDEYFLWSRSRTQGIATGVDWSEAVTTVRTLQKDVLKWIDGKDYLELVEFVGWSAYPDSDWFNRKRRG